MALAVTDYAGHEIAGVILYAVDGTALLGQKVAASSIPVVLASDTGLPTGTNNLGTIKATNPDGTNIGGTGGSSHTDDAAFTPASDDGTVMMAFADETSPDSVDEGDAGAVRMTRNRYLYVASGPGNQVLANAVALRDANLAYLQIGSLPAGAKNLKIYIYNTLDQAVNIAGREFQDGILFNAISVAAGAVGYIMPYGAVEGSVLAVKPILISPPHYAAVGDVRITYQAVGIPTSGALTIIAMWEQ